MPGEDERLAADVDSTSANRLDKADSTAQKREQKAAPVRAINEDDDGYDPYTDWHDRRVSEPLFERDPWN